MIFELSIEEHNQVQDSIRVAASDWFAALQEGLSQQGLPWPGELDVTLLQDQRSAVVSDAQNQRIFHVLALGEQVDGLDVAGQEPSQPRSFFRYETEETPVQPTVKPDSFSLAGRYVEGATTDFLTEAFMKVGDLYEHFQDDFERAMEHLFGMLQKATQATGGGMLLSSLDDPSKALRLAYSMGPHAQLLAGISATVGQGVLGHCARYERRIQVDDLGRSEEFPEDPLFHAGLPAGPLLCVPIRHEQRLQGVLLLYRQAPAEPFAPGECSIFDYLSTAIGAYLHRSRG